MSAQGRPETALIRRCATSREANTYALVLSARGIDSLIVQHADASEIFTIPEDANRAVAELAAYDRENPYRPSASRSLAPVRPNMEFLFSYWATLIFFFLAARGDRLSVDWLKVGAGEAGAIRAGEWWRTVTALFLHVDSAHLLSNLVFGSIFLFLLSQVLGSGMTAFAVLVAGAIGNALNALVRPASHTSIGASTAIFAAVGLLAALRQDWRHWRLSRNPRDWLPLVGGVMLLAFLGFSEGQVDVLAHVFGFIAGVGIGALIARSDRPWLEDQPAQAKFAWLAAGLALFAWLFAIAS